MYFADTADSVESTALLPPIIFSDTHYNVIKNPEQMFLRNWNRTRIFH